MYKPLSDFGIADYINKNEEVYLFSEALLAG